MDTKFNTMGKKNYLVTYYSKTGNNQFVAEKISEMLDCPVKEIDPTFNYLGLQFLLSVFNLNTKTNIYKADLSCYDEIIVCGPIWGGLLISPLRKVIRKCLEVSKPVHFITCCGTGDEAKAERYGYGGVLKRVKELSPSLIRTVAAIPVVLILTPEEANDPELAMKTRLSEETYTKAFRDRLQGFVQAVQRLAPSQLITSH